MKLARILMLGLGLAVFAGVASAEPAAAQCWDCQYGNLPDQDGNLCANCTADQSGLGMENCSTPECTQCHLGGRLCMVFSMLDGRAVPVAPVEQSEVPVSVASGELQAFTALYGSPAPVLASRRSSEVSRSCDGSIISRRYTATQVSTLRGETAQLRL